MPLHCDAFSFCFTYGNRSVSYVNMRKRCYTLMTVYSTVISVFYTLATRRRFKFSHVRHGEIQSKFD